MDRQKVAKEAIAHYNKIHANPSSEAKNFYIGGWLDGVQELYSLVKRMREAQKELDTCSIGDYDFRQHCASQLESEVDEWLEKLNK